MAQEAPRAVLRLMLHPRRGPKAEEALEFLAERVLPDVLVMWLGVVPAMPMRMRTTRAVRSTRDHRWRYSGHGHDYRLRVVAMVAAAAAVALAVSVATVRRGRVDHGRLRLRHGWESLVLIDRPLGHGHAHRRLRLAGVVRAGGLLILVGVIGVIAIRRALVRARMRAAMAAMRLRVAGGAIGHGQRQGENAIEVARKTRTRVQAKIIRVLMCDYSAAARVGCGPCSTSTADASADTRRRTYYTYISATYKARTLKAWPTSVAASLHFSKVAFVHVSGLSRFLIFPVLHGMIDMRYNRLQRVGVGEVER